MIRKEFFAIVAVVALLYGIAEPARGAGAFRADPATVDIFPENELNLDLFGTWANGDRFGVKRDDGRWGSGVGLNYFLKRYLGIGADTYIEEWKWPYRVNGSLLLRYPFPGRVSLAPYAFGGGGREFKYVAQWTFHGGAGLELRFNRHTSIFADGRRVIPDTTADYTLARAGVRISF